MASYIRQLRDASVQALRPIYRHGGASGYQALEQRDTYPDVDMASVHAQQATTFSEEPLPKGSGLLDRKSEESSIGIAGHNPFSDREIAEHWEAVYENAQYECRHIYDPHVTWTEEEERALVRKLDWRVCLWAVSSLMISTTEHTYFWIVYNVLRAPSRPREPRPSSRRQHARRPEPQHG